MLAGSMNRLAPAITRPPEEISTGLLKKIHWTFAGLFLIALIGAGAVTLFPGRILAQPDALQAGLVLLTGAFTLIYLSRQLPGQNVLLAAAIMAFIGSLAHSVSALTSVPFGRFVYTPAAGPQFFDALAWFIPFLWVIVLLNSRGVARLILRPWRKTRVYGFWVIGLTAGLALLFVLGMEPFATRVKSYWLWAPSKVPFDWYGVPISNFFGWVVVTLITLGFATPALIKKKQLKAPTDYSPLIIWIGLNLLFVTGAFTHQLWAAVAFGLTTCVVVTGFAVSGARW
jgi:uncharacterized membrane protein